jgi:hypothetical protein
MIMRATMVPTIVRSLMVTVAPYVAVTGVSGSL